MPLYTPPNHHDDDPYFGEGSSTPERIALKGFVKSPDTSRRYSHNNHGVFGYKAPPAPQKLRRETADDIVECAMKLMDLAMDQNRMIKQLESVIEDNYKPNKSYDKYKD